MNNERFDLENEIEQKMVLYNFNKRINKELESGSTLEIMQIISAYNIYMITNMNLIKAGKK